MTAHQDSGQGWLSSAPAFSRPAYVPPSGGGLSARYESSTAQGYARSTQMPAVWPVVVWTFFFGVLGLISVLNRSKRAKALGRSDRDYWVAFAATMAASCVLGVALAVLSIFAGISVMS